MADVEALGAADVDAAAAPLVAGDDVTAEDGEAADVTGAAGDAADVDVQLDSGRHATTTSAAAASARLRRPVMTRH